MTFKRRSDWDPNENQEKRVQELMASQADLFAPKDDTPWAKFPEKNKPVQGVVVAEPIVGQAWDPAKKAPATYPDGNPVPQLTVKVQQNDGTLIRIGFTKAKLSALKFALQSAGVSEVKMGGTIGIAWTDDKATDSGFAQKLFTVKYVAPSE